MTATPDEYFDHLKEWYVMETMGGMVTSGLARLKEDERQKAALTLLGRLETISVTWIEDIFKENGIMLPDTTDALVMGETILSEMASMSWDEFLSALRPGLQKWADQLVEMEQEALPQFAAIARYLTEHELAWLEFTEKEMAGSTATSLDRAKALVSSLG